MQNDNSMDTSFTVATNHISPRRAPPMVVNGNGNNVASTSSARIANSPPMSALHGRQVGQRRPPSDVEVDDAAEDTPAPPYTQVVMRAKDGRLQEHTAVMVDDGTDDEVEATFAPRHSKTQ